MYFNSKKVAFSRHESFSLRFGWLTKGIRAFEENKNVFTQEESVVTLGVGRNMVNSIRHWLRATQLIIIDGDRREVTPIGKAVFSTEDGWDPFLEDEATIWLIHWLIATNPEHATAWYWFFNHFHKPEFSSLEVSNALIEFMKEKTNGKIAASSIKQDINVLLRTYTQSLKNKRNGYEDVLDSPLSLLKLVSYFSGSQTYSSRLEQRDSIPLGIFGYAITDLLRNIEESQIPIEDLIYCKEGRIAPASVFRLTENSLLMKLEQLIQVFPELFAMDQTAGVHQFFCYEEIDPLKFLKYHYESNATIEAI